MIEEEQEVDSLLTQLSSKQSQIRNVAALRLADIKADRAVNELLKAIFKKENFNYNGTLVYALQALDCSCKLKEIFEILFYQGYEAKLGAYTILSEQVFEFASEDLLTVERMWHDCVEHPYKCPDFDSSEVSRMIKDAVDSYLSYLKG
ncbi:hypothetical protein GCM10027592_53430 [Spirosoma flavus]